MSRQDWRSFIEQVEKFGPSEFIRISDEVSPAYEITALIAELERKGTAPLLIFENVKGYSSPVVTNLLGSRTRVAQALKVNQQDLHREYSQRISSLIPEKTVRDSP